MRACHGGGNGSDGLRQRVKDGAFGSSAGEHSGESTAAATEAQNVKPEDIVDINVMVYDRGSEFSSGNSLTDNELTRWINEAMEPQGVHVNFVPVPRSGADDQVNLMLTAGTALISSGHMTDSVLPLTEAREDW